MLIMEGNSYDIQQAESSWERGSHQALSAKPRCETGGFLCSKQRKHYRLFFLDQKYDADGLSGLYRTKTTPTILPEGIEENEENLRRDLIRTRIELERLKKGYTQIRDADGKPTGYVPVYDKTTKS